MQFLSGGADAASALPASTVAMASIDLDPGAAQKVEAIKTLRKFPGLRKQLKINSTSDLRRSVFQAGQRDGDCKNLDYDRDIAPWIGDSAAVGGVPLGGSKLTPVLALAVTDQGKADAGLKKLATCDKKNADSYTGKWAFVDGFALLSDTQAHADAAAKATNAGSLADDAGYQTWTKRAGDQGIVDFYVAKAASTYLEKAVDTKTGGSDSAQLKKYLGSFEGAAGALRFADGGMELAVVAGGAKTGAGNQAGTLATGLPNDTAAAFAVSVPADFAQTVASGLNSSGLLSEIPSQLGITLPDDLQTLVGQGVALSLGGKVPANLNALADPSALPVGLSVAGGDATKIQDLITRLQQKTGAAGSAFSVKVIDGGGKAIVSLDPTYASQLKSQSGLGAMAGFQTVVPNAKDAQVVAYVDFDSDWVKTLAKSGSTDTRTNLEPLRALGLSAWRDGDLSHLLLKVTTD